MTRELLVDLRDDRKLGIVNLAVDIDRHEFLGCFLDLGKEFLDTRGLSRSGQSLADRIERPAAPEPGPDLERELAHLGVAELELLGNIVDLQHVRVAEERFVPHQQVLLHCSTRLPHR